MNLYEGMFVIDAGRVARDWEGTRDAVTAVLTRHGASLENGWRFEERKLAYPIQGVRRGVYLLQYFQADPEAIAEMRVDLNLSEYILRYMILRVESGVAPETPTLGTATPVPAEAAIPGKEPPAEKPAEKPAEEKP
ncbi:MAG: 30S ribosomal protein S6, partial [Planctomycetota bacterium]